MSVQTYQIEPSCCFILNMTRYRRNEDALKKYDDLPGAPVYRHRYRCSKCSNPIKESYAGPAGECYFCGVEDQDISPIEYIESSSLYFVEKDWGEANGDIIYDLIQFSREIWAAKELEHTNKMVELLKYGILRANYQNFDVIVVPPSSSSGPNHMVPKAEAVGNEFGIKFENVIVERDPTGQTKSKSSASVRWEDAEENYLCETTMDDKRVLILDDVVVSCSTVVGVANAVSDKGASQIGVVSMARSVDLHALTNNNLLIEQ